MVRKPSPIVSVFLTVFIDLLAFGMFIPDIQLRAESLGAKGLGLGILLASYSAAQLLFAPFLGRLSDKIGRRPVLVVTVLLGILCFISYAHADQLWWMFLSRVLAGVSGANIGVAFAYVADITKPEERAKGIGMVGAAFGLGFIIGPPLGAMLVKWGGGQPLLLGYFAVALSLINLVFVLFVLPESLKKETSALSTPRSSQWNALMQALKVPGLSRLLLMFFVANFAFSNLESTFFRLAVEGYRLNQEQGAYLLAFVGVVIAFVQGYLVGRLMPWLGEIKMLRWGYILMVPTLILMPHFQPWLPLMGVMLVLAVGNGIAGPSLSSLISRSAPKDMQGGIFGINQSLGALARILGPIVGNVLFEVGHAWPYAAAGVLTCAPLIGAWGIQTKVLEPEIQPASSG